MRVGQITILVVSMMLMPGLAAAHTSEGGFVLLLPTTAYIVAGVAAVLLTVIALFILPPDDVIRLFKARPLTTRRPERAAMISSLASLGLMVLLILIGLTGPRDPLSNLMSLGFWTVGWITLVSLAGILGNFWIWINPWTGLYRLLGKPGPFLTLPSRLGLWPATLLLIGFAAFLLADIAPEDPARLATFVSIYWTVTALGLLVFGPAWLTQAELGHTIIATYSKLSAFRPGPKAGIGGPGWQLVEPDPMRAAGIFVLTLLAVGSFDGINETYWWLGQIGVNPLEFPGRSAVVNATLTGLIASVVGLFGIFAVTIWLGIRLGRSGIAFSRAFGHLALSLLPIALVYHIAHYLTAFLVSIQYTFAALSDPFGTGADLLGIAPFRVTTGFFNAIDSVRLIWLTQAGLVVIGHMWSVLLSHRIALDLFGHDRRAALATLPLSLFMIGYTCLGLWLLAAPKGA